MALMQEPVLVLNATYEPINVTAVRRAMVLDVKRGWRRQEELHNAEVHSAAHTHRVPSVIRLLAYRHIPQQSRALSRKNILLRDRNNLPVLWADISELGTYLGSCGAAITWGSVLVGEIWLPAATAATTVRATVLRKRPGSSWLADRGRSRFIPRDN